MDSRYKVLGISAIFLAMMILSGCLQNPPQETAQQGSQNVQSDTNTYYAPQQNAPAQTQPEPTQPAKPQTQPWIEQTYADKYCSEMNGSDLVNCTYEDAKTRNDVTICTTLQTQDDRYICIAQWCGSEMRDYLQCDNLAGEDDRLGCLSKCNPNPNT